MICINNHKYHMCVCDMYINSSIKITQHLGGVGGGALNDAKWPCSDASSTNRLKVARSMP